MQRRVTVRRIGAKQLLGTARHHAVITDRTVEAGGTDIGCTSGELLLLAIGSCCMGGLRQYFESAGEPCSNLSVDVFFEPHENPQQRDRIVICVKPDPQSRSFDVDALTRAATAGGVTGRIALGSDVQVRIETRPAA